MVKLLFAASLGLASFTAMAAADQPSVRVQPVTIQGPRPLQTETKDAVIRDYLESWQSLRTAFSQNRSALLDFDFVGTARDKLEATIQQQINLGLRTNYHDLAHDIQIVFYSPEGLSVQLIDNIDYDTEIYDHDKVLTTQRAHTRYIVVLTPAEARWKVRLFQADSQ